MLFTGSEYKSMREGYCYYDRGCKFEVVAAGGLDNRFIGQFFVIFPKRVPPHFAQGINLRLFEAIIHAVFAAANTRRNKEQYTESYNAFLVNEAERLNSNGVLFKDIDQNGSSEDYSFRPCDIEMALF